MRKQTGIGGEQTRKAGVEAWAYCLMSNHVHLILTPTRADPDFLPRCTGQGCVCAFLCGKAHEDRGTIKLNRKSGGWSRAGGGRSASTLHQFHQCPRGDGQGTSFRAVLLRLPWTSCICWRRSPMSA